MQKQNVVTVKKSDRTGSVVNVSKNNPNEGWIMLSSSENVVSNSRVFKNTRRGFLRGPVDVLTGLGYKDGQELPGHLYIVDQLTPIIEANKNFGLRVPQSKKGVPYTPELGNAIRTACLGQPNPVVFRGVDENGEQLPIYRQQGYCPYAEGHPRYIADNIIPVVNMDEVTAFIDTLDTANGDTAAKEARLAELTAIPKAKRTPEQETERKALVAELN
jgi:hypothetical protein